MRHNRKEEKEEEAYLRAPLSLRKRKMKRRVNGMEEPRRSRNGRKQVSSLYSGQLAVREYDCLSR